MDLNADLGEGRGDDAALLAIVTSANIACGGHAGDPVSMRKACEGAVAAGVRIGAHPSYPDREGFGRRSMRMDAAALAASLRSQCAALVDAAGSVGARVAHCKPHGALYNDAARDPALAALVADVAAEFGIPLVGLVGGATEVAASDAGIEHIAEAFLDRATGPTARSCHDRSRARCWSRAMRSERCNWQCTAL